MSNLVLLFLCFALGVWARRSNVFPADSHRIVTAWVMTVSLPALTFRSIHVVTVDATLLLGASLLWLVFLVPGLVAWWRIKRGGAADVLGATALCAGLCNTAFVGLPLLEALGGKEALGPASVVDQLGAFLALFFFAMPFATAAGGGQVNLRDSFLRLVKNPSLIALALAFALHGVEVPVALDEVLHRLADMLSPLALAAVGWQLDLKSVKGNGARLAVGLGWKLVLAPAMALLVVWLWRGQLGLTERVIIAQAGMAPMVTAGVVAAEHKLAPGLASTFIALGVPLSLLTVPLWWRLLS